MTQLDWDDAYANGKYIDDGVDYPSLWAERAAKFRATARGDFSVAYGDAPRQQYDIFTPQGTSRGIAIFIHGGYWLAFDKSYWSHLAAGAVAQGYTTAIPSYRLAPDAHLPEITEDITAMVTHIAENISGRIYLAGHSAGGHLAARIACETSGLANAIKTRLAHIMTISGLHDLRPLTKTQIGRDLKLTDHTANRESPALLRPRHNTHLSAWVGANERPEFIRQSRLIANIWTGLDAKTSLTIEPDKHHFDVIDGLAAPDSAMTKHWLQT